MAAAGSSARPGSMVEPMAATTIPARIAIQVQAISAGTR